MLTIRILRLRIVESLLGKATCATLCVLGLVLMAAYSSSSAHAQSKPSAKASVPEAKSESTVDKTHDIRDEESPATGAEAQTDKAALNSTASADEKVKDKLASLRDQIEGARSDNERSKLRRMLVDYLVALNRKGEAVTELRAMLRADRIDPIGFYNISNALARLGDTETAIEGYRKAIKQRHGNYARALNNLGVLLLRQGKWDDAQQALTTALRLENFRYGEASFNLGRLYYKRGEADLAIREWVRALAYTPDHSDAAIELARAYAEDGAPEKGISVLDQFIARRGSTKELADARREIMFRDSQPVTASPSSAVDRKSPATEISKTETNSRSTAPAAPKSAKRSSGLRPLSVDRETYDLLQRAREAREKGRGEDAVALYKRAISNNRGLLPPANLELGFVLSGLKRHEEAIETLATLANREGARYPMAHYYLAREYELLGQLNLAAEEFQKVAAALSDESPQFLLDLSRVKEKEGDSKAALVALESFVRLSEKLGRAPDWSAARLAELRRKASQ